MGIVHGTISIIVWKMQPEHAAQASMNVSLIARLFAKLLHGQPVLCKLLANRRTSLSVMALLVRTTTVFCICVF
eukprot:SAG22_NODE_1277_length_4907_cov_2.638311_4_plen_74_part_00